MLTHSSLSAGSSPSPTAVAPRDFSLSARKFPPRRILVVDDESLVRWAVTETLEAAGYEVLGVGDGESALRAMAEAPDVVLLDLRLPDSQDLHILEAMLRLAPGTPVVLMTAYGTQEIVGDALRIGAFSVFAKPFDVLDLVPLVSRALASRPS